MIGPIRRTTVERLTVPLFLSQREARELLADMEFFCKAAGLAYRVREEPSGRLLWKRIVFVSEGTTAQMDELQVYVSEHPVMRAAGKDPSGAPRAAVRGD